MHTFFLFDLATKPLKILSLGLKLAILATHENRPGYNLETEDGLHPTHSQGSGGWMDLNSPPDCGDCGAGLTVDHLLWECPTLQRQRIECNIYREKLSGDEDEIRRLIRYVQKIGVYH
jgi:hypothetical protein